MIPICFSKNHALANSPVIARGHLDWQLDREQLWMRLRLTSVTEDSQGHLQSLALNWRVRVIMSECSYEQVSQGTNKIINLQVCSYQLAHASPQLWSYKCENDPSDSLGGVVEGHRETSSGWRAHMRTPSQLWHHERLLKCCLGVSSCTSLWVVQFCTKRDTKWWPQDYKRHPCVQVSFSAVDFLSVD